MDAYAMPHSGFGQNNRGVLLEAGIVSGIRFE
jgi:hypothetical protein